MAGCNKKCQDLEVKWKEIGKLNFENNKKSWDIFRKKFIEFFIIQKIYLQVKKKRKSEKN